VANSRTQRFITGLAPSSWAASLEAESRAWMVRCPARGFARSVWDMGGIRWKATGKQRLWMRCPNCGKRGWHTLSRQDPAGAGRADVAGPLG
jgi:hypothetical protein